MSVVLATVETNGQVFGRVAYDIGNFLMNFSIIMHVMFVV